MILSDIIEHNIVDDSRTPLLRCILFIGKEKIIDIKFTGQYINYQPCNNLQIKKLLKKFFHSKNIELRDTTCEKLPIVSGGITRKAECSTNFHILR